MAKKQAAAAAPCLFYMSLLAALVLILGVVLVSGDPITSCSQTPYPQVCYSSLNMSSTTGSTPPVIVAQDGTYKPAGFGQLNLQACRDLAQQVLQLASSSNYYYDHMMTGSLDARARAAWDDCLELSQVTLDHLNRLTGSAAGTTSADDVQTWLSAAMANQETCRNGFVDFDLAQQLPSLPFTSNNVVSQLLSNSLAISTTGSDDINPKPQLQQPGGGPRRLLSAGGNYFPTWVSAADRRLLQSSTVKANLVVAKDGSGNYKTISEAVAASAKFRSGSTGGRFVIYVKAGVYSENVEVTKSMKNVMLVGDGIDRTVVTGSRNVQDGSTTFRSATFAAVGNGFIARDMTFQNTAGPQKHQAVALRSGSDLSVFYRCSFKGYQDTLYVHSQRQFYRECDIYGTVDFIFGDAVAVLQNCNIYIRRPMSNQKNTVTAQGRTDPNENTGISIHNSRVTAASDLKPVQGSFKSYLGRPWQKYSRTVFMQSNLDGLIDPAGWLEWSGNFALSTLYYGEYGNTGAGADTSRRVKWGGYRVITSATEAAKFTVGNFLSGNSWIPATGVPFNAGLL